MSPTTKKIFQFCTNCALQYTALVFTKIGSCSDPIDPRVFLTPIEGLGIAFKFVKSAQGPGERTLRIANLAAYAAMSATTTFIDPANNIAAGVSVAMLIVYMKSVLKKLNNEET